MRRALAAMLLAAPGLAGAEPFTDGTARMPEAGRVEVGVLAPLRWAPSDGAELSLHPLAFFVAPHADVKLGWGEPGGVALATVHGLAYPTPLMRLLARQGTGGLVPDDVRWPHLLATNHHLYATLPVASHLVTARLGGRLAWNLTAFDGPRFWSEIEWHFVRPRTAAWTAGWSADGGLSAQGPIAGPFRYRADVDLFIMPGMRGGDRAVEGMLLLEWRRSPGFRLQAGAAFSWARFPYGARFLWPPFPIVDAAWSWGGAVR